MQLKIIINSPELIKAYGVKHASPLLQLNNSDVCKCLLHDPMHVLVEGVCIKELQNLLKYLIDQRGIKLDEINKRIILFQYPFIDSTDKPNSITKDHLLKRR